MTPTPPWMIEELERMRREREVDDRPVLHIIDERPLPPRTRDGGEPPPEHREPIVIEF
jgi:hypothetical protein